MFKSILRFVKSAHFFAIAFACIFGVFFTTNSSVAYTCSQYSGHTCPSGQYWHVINNKCQTCPNDGRSDCSDGVFKCPRNGNTTYHPYIYVSEKNDPNNNEYHCGIFSTNGGRYYYSSCGEGKSYKECVLYHYWPDRTGCSVTTPQGTFDNYAMKQETRPQDASGDWFDPCTGTTFYGISHGLSESGFVYNAMPGYYKSGDGTCTQCDGYTASPGGSATSCIPCPYGLGSPGSYDSSYFLDRIMDGFIVGNGGSISLATRGSASSDRSKCEITGVSKSDDTGTYLEGSCTMTPVDRKACFLYAAPASSGRCDRGDCSWLYSMCGSNNLTNCDMMGIMASNVPGFDASLSDMAYNVPYDSNNPCTTMGFPGNCVTVVACFDTEYDLQYFIGNSSIKKDANLLAIYDYYD